MAICLYCNNFFKEIKHSPYLLITLVHIHTHIYIYRNLNISIHGQTIKFVRFPLCAYTVYKDLSGRRNFV